MTFDDLLGDVRNNCEVVIPSDWGQGRATFGGLVAALVFEVMASKVADDRAMRALQVSFVGPVEPDVPARVEAEVLREGKAVSQVQGRILQNGEPALSVWPVSGATVSLLSEWRRHRRRKRCR